MIRWRRIIGVSVALVCLLAPGAHAATGYGKAALVSCDREAREAVFAGRAAVYRKARIQLRFTLQVSTRDLPRWQRVDAEGFGEWISAPAGVGKYTYDKTVLELLPGASYRMVVNFRWRDARGKTIRSERSVSPVCRVPDSRPDLVVRSVETDRDGYVAVVANRGRAVAGPFDVAFVVGGVPLGSARVVGLEPGATLDVFLPGSRCARGEVLEAIADPGSEVDEADEENDSLSGLC